MHEKIAPVFKKLGCLGLALSLSAAQAAGQASRGGGAGAGVEEASAAERELEKNAVALLEETVREAESLKLAENRVRVQTAAAGLLWPRDEEAARAAFKRAAEAITALISETDPSDPQYYNERGQTLQLRQQLISTAAAHDARLALEFLRATRQPPPFSYPDAQYKQADPELNLETQLAAQVAAQDAKQALRMAEESLGRGVSQGLASVFQQLAAKDKEAAARLATEIIKRLRAEDLARDYESSNVALALFSQTRGEAAGAESSAASPPPADGAEVSRIVVLSMAQSKVVLDERSRRRLVETLVAAALLPNPPRDNGLAQNIARTLLGSPGEVERYAPARVAALKRRVESASDADPRAHAWKAYNELMQGATSVEAILEVAPKVPHEARDQLYSNAAYQALGENNNVARARAIAENIANPERRAQVVRDVERQHRMNLAQQGNIDDARQLVARLATAEEKVQFLTQLSAVALSRDDRATARALLEEARALVGRGETAQQFYGLFNVARSYAQLDESVTYEMVELAIGRLNELMAAAVVVNGFGQEAFREGELRQQGGYMWNDLIGRCAQELALLAPRDFERARALTQGFERTDARTLARLLLAQHILQSANSNNGRRIHSLGLPTGRDFRSGG